MGHETTSTAVNVGCKVLPICDVAVTPVASKGGDNGGEKEVARTSERRRAVARMKQELLRWAAAAAKSGKGRSKAWKVLYSRNKLKPEAESPECSSAGKVSFKWDAGSCSGASSVCSPLSLPSTSTSRNDHSHIHTNSASRLSFTCEKPRHGPTISSTSTAAAAGDEPVRNGQWITTDSEFVVLEL